MDEIFLKDVEAILFDFEGTLVDFQWNLARAVRETIEMLKTLRFPIQRFEGMKYSTLMLEALRIARFPIIIPNEYNSPSGDVSSHNFF